jgi:hypothetical protein
LIEKSKNLRKHIFINTTCPQPIIEIGSIQTGEGFEIGGSFVLGEFGVPLFSYSNPGTDPIVKTVNLFNPANAVNPILYPFISVRAYPPAPAPCEVAGDIVIDFIRFFACSPVCTCVSIL